MLNIFCILSSFCCLICIIIMRNQIRELDVSNQRLWKIQISSNESLVKLLASMLPNDADKEE